MLQESATARKRSRQKSSPYHCSTTYFGVTCCKLFLYQTTWWSKNLSFCLLTPCYTEMGGVILLYMYTVFVTSQELTKSKKKTKSRVPCTRYHECIRQSDTSLIHSWRYLIIIASFLSFRWTHKLGVATCWIQCIMCTLDGVIHYL